MQRLRLHRHLLLLILALATALIAPLGATASPVIEDDPGNPVQLSRAGVAYHLVDAVFNDRDAAAAASLISEDAVIHTAQGDFTGPQGLLDYIARFRILYPDAHFEATSVSATDTGVALEWTMTATRFVISPSNAMLQINAEIPAAATITLDDGQVAQVTVSSSEIATARSPQVAANYGPTA